MHFYGPAGGPDGVRALIGVELRTGIAHIVEFARDPQFEETAPKHVGGGVAVDGGDVSRRGDFGADGREGG